MIEYILNMEDGEKYHFVVDLDRNIDDLSNINELPEWTRLGHCQCTNCPLTPEKIQVCPPAVDLNNILTHFIDVLSFTRAEVTVICSERTYIKESDVQNALRSLLGLVMATSACPILSRLKPMAVFHLPFSNRRETVFRVVGTYFIRQYYRMQENKEVDLTLDSLKEFYRELGELNNGFTQRIRSVARKDANVNAVIELVNLAFLVTMSLESELEDLKSIFGI